MDGWIDGWEEEVLFGLGLGYFGRSAGRMPR
jgi:hypothetical protein